MLPEPSFCKWHIGENAVSLEQILKRPSHTIYSMDNFNDLIEFCCENAQKFLAKLWFQNLLSAKLSFQSFNVSIV